MARFGHSSPSVQPESSSAETRAGPEFEPVSLGSSSVLKPLTPPNVLNLTPNTCLAVSEFRVLLRQYRALDDGITTRLNRSFARSRDLGQSPSPSLLSGGGKVTSSSSTDLGTSTYANAAPGACATFWRELVDAWIGREEVVKFCIRVVDDKTASLPSPQPPQKLEQPKPTKRSSADDKLLDADYLNRVRSNPSLAARNDDSSQSLVDDVGRSGSRSENTAQVLRRQLHNELAVESIIRARSLDGTSRCNLRALNACTNLHCSQPSSLDANSLSLALRLAQKATENEPCGKADQRLSQQKPPGNRPPCIPTSPLAHWDVFVICMSCVMWLENC